MKKIYLFVLLLNFLLLSTVGSTQEFTFNDNEFNDLTGELNGYVMFAQGTVIPAGNHIAGDVQPHLVANRKTKVLLKVLGDDVDYSQPVYLNVKNNNIPELIFQNGFSSNPGWNYIMNSPENLARIAGTDGLSALNLSVNDFNVPANHNLVIQSLANLRLLDNSAHFESLLLANNKIKIQTADGRWVSTFNVPGNQSMDGNKITFTSSATFDSVIIYSGRSQVLKTGQTLVLRNYSGQWISYPDYELSKVTYGDGFWSVNLPSGLIQPELKLKFSHNNKVGSLLNINIGAPTEALIHTIDIGMLVPNRNAFTFQRKEKYHRQYFQQLPMSKLIVTEYAPVHLTEVRMPDGAWFTGVASGQGGVHSGSLRNFIGKSLISLGINHANYGLNSSDHSASVDHYVSTQITAHNSIGRYENGVVIHGLSGGGSMVTLKDSTGNEFSHELGHNYGVGHYPGGFAGSVHQQADQKNSTWGWDSDYNHFIPNFFTRKTNGSTCYQGQCQSPFNGYAFGWDAMAGGSPNLHATNEFTLHTPYSLQKFQSFMENKVVFSKSSSTGFRKWNPNTKKMVDWKNVPLPTFNVANASPAQVSLSQMSALLTNVEKINIRFIDGTWTRHIYVPNANQGNKFKEIYISHGATFHSVIHINGSTNQINNGQWRRYYSNGSTWVNGPSPLYTGVKKPLKQGVAVTTLIGYYDPNNQLSSYIYPAFRGAYGMVYNSDSDDVIRNDACYLEVEDVNGLIQKFRLHNYRFSNQNYMNKFHVNVETNHQPIDTSIICNNTTLVSRQIEAAPADLNLGYTINGR